MYDVYDWVRVKENFWNITPTRSLGVDPRMLKFAGNEYQIRIKGHNGINTRYKLFAKEDNWLWDENWFEPTRENIFQIDESEIDTLFKE